MVSSTESVLKEVPPPDAVRKQIVDNRREPVLLRRLLALSQRAHPETASQQEPVPA